MSKKEKVAFVSDSFMDKSGVKHSFVIAAVSIPVEGTCITVAFDEEGDVNPDSRFSELPITKVVSLGYSFCNANDQFDLELGKKIAEGRAKKYLDRVMMTSDSGMINTRTVDAILSQEADFVKANPQLFIKGFKE